MKIKLGLPEGLHEAALASRLAWLIGLRLAFLTLLLGLTQVLYLRSALAVDSYSIRVALFAFGLAFALAGVYAWALRRGRHLVGLAQIQVVCDQITWTLLVYVSGGVLSGATAFYGLSCLTGAILIGLRGAALAAVSGIAAFSMLSLGFATELIKPPPDQANNLYVTDPEQMAFPYLVNVLGIVVVMLLAGYLTERLRLTGGRLVEATARAEQAERLAALGQLSAGLAHEIRNPLGSILGCIQLLSSDEGLGDEARQLCAIVERETERLNDLVSDMVDLSRPRKPAPSIVNAARTARDVVVLAARSGRGSDVDVRYEGPDTLQVVADAGQLRQVVWNLVRNAVQASGPGAPVLVRVGTSADDDGPFLEVRDEGAGIPPAAMDQLFDAFFTTRSSGMGIGLAVVKRIVDDHGWTIAASSEKGKGASFLVKMVSRKESPRGSMG